MARLFPLLPFHSDETPRSWAARMAAFHIRGPIDTFLRDLGLDPLAFSLGEPDEVIRLCDLAGQDQQTVLRNTLVHVVRRAYRLGSEHLIDTLCRAEDLRFCPACLAEDDAAAVSAKQDSAIHRRERLAWRLKAVRCCPAHGRPLIRRMRPDGTEGMGAFAGGVPETTAMLEDIARSSERRSASPLQTYVAGKIKGHPGPAWLDNQPLEQAIRSSEVLGAVFAFGPHAAFDNLSDSEGDVASTCGWRFTSRGEAGVRRAFRIMQARADQKDPVIARRIRNTFGTLLDEVQRISGNCPIRLLLHEHITNTAGTASGK